MMITPNKPGKIVVHLKIPTASLKIRAAPATTKIAVALKTYVTKDIGIRTNESE